ncbi:hypothetical protein [Streptomyces sp. NPDC003832]
MALRKIQDEVISFSAGRRQDWKGLSPDGIRKAIRYAAEHGNDLRLFRLSVDPEGWAVYTEIPPADWDALFVQSAPERLKASGQLIETTNAYEGEASA